MTDRVVAFPGMSVPLQGEADPKVVEILEEALAKARSGHVTGVAIATATRSHMRYTHFHVTGEFAHDLAAAVMSLGFRFARMQEDMAGEVPEGPESAA